MKKVQDNTGVIVKVGEIEMRQLQNTVLWTRVDRMVIIKILFIQASTIHKNDYKISFVVLTTFR